MHAPTAPGFVDRLENWQRENQLHDRFYESRGTHFRVLFEGPTDDALARRIVEILEAAYRNVGGALRAYPSHTITRGALTRASSFMTLPVLRRGPLAPTMVRSGYRFRVRSTVAVSSNGC